jgi:lipopolysaccharide transport system ATP-binding protein
MALISLQNVSVHFPVYGSGHRSLKSTVVRAATGGVLDHAGSSDRLSVRALDEITLEFRHGDRVGLVGPNGSGKSTLLRVIAGSYEPVSGSVEVQGRVASMLSLWLGMDLDATGYENIFIRAAIMGVKRRVVDALVDDIAEFTELGEYLNMPLRTYSSGMAMRLAFAISTSVSADIILMDEWLSAGDASFAAKAKNRLTKVLDEAKILVLASHQLDLIKAQCNRIVGLEHGRVSFIENVSGFREEVPAGPIAASQTA